MIKRGMNGGVEWLHACAGATRGVVFAPPLIGGDGIQQIRMLRPLLRHGLDLFSFNYAGHGHSKGSFSLQAALDNCLRILDQALDHSRQAGANLYGLASCFAVVPLLHASTTRDEPMRKLVMINAVPHLRLRSACANFLRYWHRSGSWLSDLDRLPRTIRAYMNELLPGVTHRPQAFGVLVRQRVQWPRLTCELLSRAGLPKSLKRTQVMCAYGRKDRLLPQLGFRSWQQYESLIQSISPGTRFLPLDGGHFLTCPSVRYALIKEVVDFFISPQGR